MKWELNLMFYEAAIECECSYGNLVIEDISLSESTPINNSIFCNTTFLASAYFSVMIYVGK